MGRMKDIDIAIRTLSNAEPPLEFGTYIKVKETLEHCKKIVRKGNVKKENTTKVKSKAIKEWRDSWFGKEK